MEQNSHGSKYGEKVWSRDIWKGRSEPAPPGDPTHILLPNADTLVDAKKYMMTGA